MPQGSVLGPLLFLIFINDMPYLLSKLNCKLFADDTTLCDSHEKLDSLIRLFIRELENLCLWCNNNRLDINCSKTFFMFCTNKRIKLPTEISIQNNKVQVVSSFKFLGVKIDDKLNFLQHAANIRKIVNKKMFSIKIIILFFSICKTTVF